METPNLLSHPTPPDSGAASNGTQLIEQYKVVRSSITDLQHDRNANNNFLIAIVTFIISGEAYLLKTPLEATAWRLPHHLTIILAVIAIIGAILCLLWIRWNKSYGSALKVRYDLLTEMEKHLPAQPYTMERTLRQASAYVSITSTIEYLACLFGAIFFLQLPVLLLLATTGC